MTFHFSAEIIEWRGPAPFLFVPVPSELSGQIKAVSALVTYGWGCIPAEVQIGGTTFTTSLFPKDGRYLVPVKVAVQRSENAHVGDLVEVVVELSIR